MNQQESITLFTKPGCGACIATKQALNKRNLKYDIKDVTQDPDAFDYVTKKLGFSGLPVVETDSDSWSGINLDKINRIK